MKVLTDEGVSRLEDILSCRITNDQTDFRMKCYYTSLIDMNAAIQVLKEKGAEFVKEGDKTLLVNQTECQKLLDVTKYFKDERVWPTTGGQLIPTSEMDHQRLSNCCGLLGLLLEKGKIDKEAADVYLARLEDSIVPELQERFGGDVLPYQPYFEWEKKLVAE